MKDHLQVSHLIQIAPMTFHLFLFFFFFIPRKPQCILFSKIGIQLYKCCIAIYFLWVWSSS
ncbi:hypothetical protein V469_09145 [Aeromonas hydrophila J-1]|nr:hypothetical protein V469_09145 [Aeromonas hydrophila J-1]